MHDPKLFSRLSFGFLNLTGLTVLFDLGTNTPGDDTFAHVVNFDKEIITTNFLDKTDNNDRHCLCNGQTREHDNENDKFQPVEQNADFLEKKTHCAHVIGTYRPMSLSILCRDNCSALALPQHNCCSQQR